MGLGLWAGAGLLRHEGPGREVRDPGPCCVATRIALRRRPRLSLGAVASPQSRPPFHRKVFFWRMALLEALGSGRLIGEDDALGNRFVLLVVPPVGLEEHGVDLFEIDGFGAVAHGFDDGADAEVLDGAERPFRAADDEVGRGFGEGVVGEGDSVELAVDEVGHGVRGE